jgi:hypothetical protein
VAIVSELGDLLDVCASTGETVEYFVQVGTLLHGNDTELILFVHPHEEGLLIVVEDTSAFGPFSVQTAGFQESISLPIMTSIRFER